MIQMLRPWHWHLVKWSVKQSLHMFTEMFTENVHVMMPLGQESRRMVVPSLMIESDRMKWTSRWQAVLFYIYSGICMCMLCWARDLYHASTVWLDESGWFTCTHTRMALSTWGVPVPLWEHILTLHETDWNCLWEFHGIFLRSEDYNSKSSFEINILACFTKKHPRLKP